MVYTVTQTAINVQNICAVTQQLWDTDVTLPFHSRDINTVLEGIKLGTLSLILWQKVTPETIKHGCSHTFTKLPHYTFSQMC